MTGFLPSLREWWRWRMRRSRVHLPGIVAFRTVGTVVEVEEGSFRVENDADGRTIWVMANPWIAEVKTADRVEIEPRYPSTVAGRWVSSLPLIGFSCEDWILGKLDHRRLELRL
jgi:hypothetical protein